MTDGVRILRSHGGRSGYRQRQRPGRTFSTENQSPAGQVVIHATARQSPGDKRMGVRNTWEKKDDILMLAPR